MGSTRAVTRARWRTGLLAAAVLSMVATMLVVAPATSAAAEDGYRATIERDGYGVPHITAEDTPRSATGSATPSPRTTSAR